MTRSEYTAIPLANHHEPTIINSDDAGLVAGYRWSLDPWGYAHGYRELVNRQPVWIVMSRLIMGVTDRAVLVDHWNHDPLDNRRRNLRLVTRGQNQHNSVMRATNTSGYKGVSRDKRTGRWLAQICRDRRIYRLGSTDDPIKAALLYDAFARIVHGEYARLNFPRDGEQPAR